MAIWRKNNLSSASEEKEIKAIAPKLPNEKEGKRKKILDLNLPYDGTEENDTEIVLLTKRSGCMVRSVDKTLASTINVHTYKTVVPPKLIVMGCGSCYMYVMVMENHRIRPKCGQGEYLIDVAAHFHANKKRGYLV